MSPQARCDLERRRRDAADEFRPSERQWLEEHPENRVFGSAFEFVAASAHAEGVGPTVWTTLDEVIGLTGIPDHRPRGSCVAKLVDRVSGSQR